jgi:hypothetical protein
MVCWPWVSDLEDGVEKGFSKRWKRAFWMDIYDWTDGLYLRLSR